MDVIELKTKAFAAQALAVLRELGLPMTPRTVNPNGGASRARHADPLGMSGAAPGHHGVVPARRRATRAKDALCTMCIGVGQGNRDDSAARVAALMCVTRPMLPSFFIAHPEGFLRGGDRKFATNTGVLRNSRNEATHAIAVGEFARNAASLQRAT